MARQLIISIIAFGFFGFAVNAAIADDIGVGKPSSSTTSTTTSSATTDDDIGVGKVSWYQVLLQPFETGESTGS